VETYTFGAFRSVNFFINKLLPLMFVRGNNKMEELKKSASGDLL
jgi:hypothetical protein